MVLPQKMLGRKAIFSDIVFSQRMALITMIFQGESASLPQTRLHASIHGDGTIFRIGNRMKASSFCSSELQA